MAVTLYDIANQAGVNTSTVSRALNDKANVNEDTKKRIHQIAQTLGLVMPAMRCLGHTLLCSIFTHTASAYCLEEHLETVTLVHKQEIKGENMCTGKN